MRTHDHYPLDTVLGGCLITGRYEVVDGEQVLDLDVDIDTLPNWGRICFSERAVRDMCTTLGWELLTPERLAEHEATLEALSDASEQLHELVEAMAGMVNLPVVERALNVAARRVAGKDSIEEWVATLDQTAGRR